MPKLPMNYSNTIIYKIVCKNIDIKECYVGQTTSFDKRKTQHKCNCNNNAQKQHNIYLYKFIREHNGWDNWEMVEVEKYNAIDKLDAGKRERYWIEQLQAKLNQQLPTQTIKEWYDKNENYNKLYYEQNKEQITIQNKQYREQNKEQILKKQKDYYEQNREQIILKNREKYNQTKDEINAKRRLYREKNKDKINAQHKLFILKKKAQA
jgi:hypothetical protein